MANSSISQNANIRIMPDAPHGAGRLMSRGAAKQIYLWMIL